LLLQRIAAQFPARWLDLMGMHGAERVPQWLFANWTLIRQHDDKQVQRCSISIRFFACVFKDNDHWLWTALCAMCMTLAPAYAHGAALRYE
jgi:hypothetical protein